MKKAILILVIFFCIKQVCAQEFLVTASGIVSFNKTQLVVGEAGSDISANLRSNTVYLSINSNYFWNMKNERWRIYVHKSDINWDDDINFTVKRTGTGKKYSGGGTPEIQGGKGYRKVTDNPTYFYKGKDKVLNIPMKFRIKKLSLTMGAEDFETDVIFTIYDD